MQGCALVRVRLRVDITLQVGRGFVRPAGLEKYESAAVSATLSVR